MKRRAVIVGAVLALLWANLPYLIGYINSTPQHRFGGFFLYEQDGYSYLAKMRQGAQGAWLFHLPYSSEETYRYGSAIYLFYLVLGKVPLDFTFLYHAARLIGSVALLWLLYRCLKRFIADQRNLLITWWLVLFSGGWGLLASYLIDQKYVPYELIAPDATIFSILYGPPHIIVGGALFLAWSIYTLDSFQADRTRLPQRLIVANVLGGLTAITREAYAPAFAGIFGAYLIARWWQRRALPWHEAIIVALSSIAAGAYGLYLVWAFHANPGLAAWSAQNPFASPNPIDFLLGFAPLLLLAVIGLRPSPLLLSQSGRGTRAAQGEGLLLIAWLVVGPIMAYLPVEISRRLIIGWQIPLCIFAAIGLQRLFEKRRVLGGLAVAAVLPTTVLIILGGSLRVSVPQPPLYITADQQAALDWLNAHTTNQDVVLSDWRFGNLVPVFADAHVFVGHPIETIDFKAKDAFTQRVFNSTQPPADLSTTIAQWAITLIVADTHRSVIALPIVFQHGSVVIYRAVR
ncbi:MAG: hypothetical protein U0559_03315 [Anaerolineae bacterium]